MSVQAGDPALCYSDASFSSVGYCVVFIRLALGSEALWQECGDSSDELFNITGDGSRKLSGVKKEVVVGRVASGVSNGNCSISYRLAR